MQRTLSSIALLTVFVAAGALLNALLLCTLLDGFAACFLNGILVMLYATENWAMMRDLEGKSAALLVEEGTRAVLLKDMQLLKAEVVSQTNARKRLEEKASLRLRMQSKRTKQKEEANACIDIWNRKWHSKEITSE
jgi:hypothetical protein